MAYKYVDDIGNIIAEQVDILQVIGAKVPLKRAGRNHKGLCPFHSEKTPSFTVSQERQSFYCFGCQKGGGVVSFVMEYENLDFLSAIETLADQQGIDLTRYLSQTSKPRADHSNLYELNRQAARFFYQSMKQAKAAQDYFSGRGLSQETIRHFGLGYAPDTWDSLTKYLTRGFSAEALEVVGLTSTSKNRQYDRFRDRVMFPILDLRRRVIGFGGRVLSDQQPKYLNSPDSPVFNKSFQLYGLHSAKDHLGANKQLLLVEGYMDVISLYEHGVKNAVASLGTAFTEGQAKLIQRYADSVIILYDGDSAGQNATKRALDIFFEIGFQAFVVAIPNGDDPDTYIVKYGRDAFLRLIDESTQDGYTYLLHQSKQRFDVSQISGQRLYLQDALAILKPITDPLVRMVYLNQISQELGLPVKEIAETPIKPTRSETISPTDYKTALLALVLQDAEVAKTMKQHMFFDELSLPWQQLVEFIGQHNGYQTEAATEVFPLDVCAVFDQRRRDPVSPKDRLNWPVLYRAMLLEDIEASINRIHQNPEMNQEDKLRQVVNKQRKIALLWNKETS